MKKYLILAVSALLLASCDKYLDEAPTKSAGTTLSTVEELSALLNNGHMSMDGTGTIEYNMAAILSSDAFGLTQDYYNAGLNFMSSASTPYQYACWAMELTENINEKVCLWNGCYSSIYTANLVLASLDKVSGTEAEKDVVAQRAHIVRAYNYLNLVQYYCMPYGEKTKDELGLPLKRSTSYDEDFTRASLQDTYDFIEKDILEGLKLQEPLFKDGVRQDWTETGALANALAARFYLLCGKYDLAQKYAEGALSYGDDLMDFNAGDELSMDIKESINWDTFEIVLEMTPSWRAASTSGDNIAKLDRAYYLRKNYYLGDYYYWAVPSEKLLNAYDQKYDLRYYYFVNPAGQKVYYFGMYSTLFMQDVPGYFTFDSQFSNAPNVAEMHLIKAEAQARQGNVAEAMNTLNAFRAKRISQRAPAEVINLNATSKEEAVASILNERMLEFPFSLRWYDIRRVNFNDDPSDDITVTREFYDMNEYSVSTDKKTFTLTPNSRNYAVAIPAAEIGAGNGKILQNKY